MVVCECMYTQEVTYMCLLAEVREFQVLEGVVQKVRTRLIDGL